VDAPSARLRLRVTPGARRAGVVGRHGDAWKIRVSAPPEDGRANDAVVDLLSRTLGVPARSLELVSGATARDKVVVLHGLTEREAEEALVASAERPTR